MLNYSNQESLIQEVEGGQDELEIGAERGAERGGVQVLVVQEAEDLEEEQQREERVQVLHTCQVNMTEIHEVSD